MTFEACSAGELAVALALIVLAIGVSLSPLLLLLWNHRK